MTVLKPRSRMISVRLSEEEYSSLRRLCALSGARSVSDLTRDSMRSLLNGISREDALGMRIDEFCAHVKNLDLTIERLVAKITTLTTENER